MACGGCRKSKKTFKHRLRKIKAKSLGTPSKDLETSLDIKPKKKRKKRLSKRSLWLRKKRRLAMKMKKANKG